MASRPIPSRSDGSTLKLGMQNTSLATLEEASDDETIFAFSPPSTADQRPQRQARNTEPKCAPTYSSRYKAILDHLRPILPPSENRTKERNSVIDRAGRNTDHLRNGLGPSINTSKASWEPVTLALGPDTPSSYASQVPGSPNIDLNAYQLRKLNGLISIPDTLSILEECPEVSIHKELKQFMITPSETVDIDIIIPRLLKNGEIIKMGDDFEAFEEDSPYPEVRASVSNIDDPTMPALTFRMWLIGLVLSIVMGSVNVFFFYRSSAPSIRPIVIQLLSHPIGKFLAYVLPMQTYRIPLPRPFSPISFSFNPGPWNIKEHALIYIMSNVSIGAPYALGAIASLRFFYGRDFGYLFNVLLALSTQITGFGLAGLCRNLFVWPVSMIWPQALVSCTLFNTLHAEFDEDEGMLTRWKLYVIVAVSSFFFFFLPGYLFQALSLFSFICWIVPDNVVVNQLFGSATGLGMNILTLDWTEISWIGSPLVTPWWAQLHFFGGFVMFYWILLPILYYTNVWELSHFPISGTRPYDRFGKIYNTSRILTPDLRFNQTAYEEYSPLYLPGTYAMTYLLAFTGMSALLVHTMLYNGKTMWKALTAQVEEDDIHSKLMRFYPEVPHWWYLGLLLIFLAAGIVNAEVWHVSLPVWGVLLAIAIPTIFLIPGGFIMAATGFQIADNLQIEIVTGRVLPGNPTANMLAKAYAVGTLVGALGFVQDLKQGHYLKLPPRATFMVQAFGTFVVTLVEVGVSQWLFRNVKDICTIHAQDHLTCPAVEVYATAGAFWGLIGPTRQFGHHSLYFNQLWAILIGVFLPIPVWLWTRWHPDSFLRYISTPLFLIGIGSIPPATGINYSSWFLVGFLFQYLLRKRNVLATSAALDSGTTISLFVIFFFLQFPKGGIDLSWWGNNVFKTTADYLGTPFRPIQSGSPLPWPS